MLYLFETIAQNGNGAFQSTITRLEKRPSGLLMPAHLARVTFLKLIEHGETSLHVPDYDEARFYLGDHTISQDAPHPIDSLTFSEPTMDRFSPRAIQTCLELAAQETVNGIGLEVLEDKTDFFTPEVALVNELGQELQTLVARRRDFNHDPARSGQENRAEPGTGFYL